MGATGEQNNGEKRLKASHIEISSKRGREEGRRKSRPGKERHGKSLSDGGRDGL